jgi:predicted AlkP superfamily pyrophosphatase or phosphodiesterase
VTAHLYRRRTWIAGIALLLVLAVLAGCGSGTGPWTPGVETTDQVLLICWDGSQRAHVQEMLADGRLPNLQQLVDEGGFAATDIVDHITETFTGHLEMLTGYPPGDLGTTNLHHFRVIPHELTLFDRLEQHFGPQDFTTVWLTSKKTKLPALPGLLWSDTKPHVDVWDGDVDRTNLKTGPLAVGYVEEYAHPGARFFMFLHFKEPDNRGHQFGENSPEYDEALIAVDGWLGQIRATLDAQSVGSTTAVCVITDHGFDEGQRQHKMSPDAWLATNWAPLRDGDQKDVTPTILTLYGIDPSTYAPPLPGHSLWAAPR